MAPIRIIFSNQKGGVGKTTLCRELGIYISSLGHQILLVDCDPQGNLTKSLVEETPTGLYEALEGDGIKPVGLGPSLSILAGDFRLSLLEKRLVAEIDCYSRLKDLFLRPQFQEYEYIFLDTPPSLGVLTVNALTAADHLLIPMNPSLYSMQGTNDLMATIAKVKKTLNPALTLLGVIINSFDSIPVITRQIKQEIKESFGDKVFHTALSKSIKLEESIASKTGVIFHKRLDKSRARLEVCALGDELLSRLDGRAVREVSHGSR
ncbi:Chromosome partitioning protein ParA [subsurface metagenome]